MDAHCDGGLASSWLAGVSRVEGAVENNAAGRGAVRPESRATDVRHIRASHKIVEVKRGGIYNVAIALRWVGREIESA